MRKHGRLNLRRHRQFRADSFLLRCDLSDLVNILHRLMRKRCEGFREHFNLVPCAVAVLHGELQVIFTQFRDLTGNPVQRANNPLAENHCPGQHQESDHTQKHGCRSPRVPGTLKVYRRSFFLYAVILCLQHVRRLGQGFPTEYGNQSPAQCLHRHTDHETGAIAQCHQPHICFLLQSLCCQRSQLRILRQPQVLCF